MVDSSRYITALCGIFLPFQLIETVFSFALSGICIVECSLFRYYTLTRKKYQVKTSTFVLFQLFVAILIILVGLLMSTYFLEGKEVTNGSLAELSSSTLSQELLPKTESQNGKSVHIISGSSRICQNT